jgi:hypothetical protein
MPGLSFFSLGAVDLGRRRRMHSTDILVAVSLFKKK